MSVSVRFSIPEFILLELVRECEKMALYQVFKTSGEVHSELFPNDFVCVVFSIVFVDLTK